MGWVRWRTWIVAAEVVLGIGESKAADLPLKASPIEYVKVCSLYGRGFFYIPGTDTCLRLGGFARADTTFNGSIHDQPLWNGDGGAHDRYGDWYSSRTRWQLTIDARTETEYGTVRIFNSDNLQFDTLGNNTYNPLSLASNLGNNTSTILHTPGGGYAGVDFVFIQFAGFTFGKSASAFSTPWNGFPGNNTAFLLGGPDSSGGVNNIQYTAELGGGVSVSVGADEQIVFDRTQLTNITSIAAASALTGAWGQGYGGQRAPDFVGRVRLDQDWGLVQLSGAAHDIDAAYYNTSTESAGHPNDTWGYVVSGGLSLKNLPTGADDTINVDATYADGDTKYVISTTITSPNFSMFGSSNAFYQSVGFGATTDGVYAGHSLADGTKIEKTAAWGVRGAFNHNWNANWSSSLFGSVSSVDYDATATALVCAKYFSGNAQVGAALFSKVSSGYSCNPDFRVYQVGTVTRWTPVNNLTFSAELLYAFLDQNFTGAALPVATPSSLPIPSTFYEFKDQGTLSLNVRVQRNF